MTCPQCHLQVPRGAKFCPECGTRSSSISEQEGGGAQATARSLGDVRTVTDLPPLAAGEVPRGAGLADRYEVMEEIGRGGFAVVYKARDRKLDRLVAVKRLRADAVDGPHASQTVARFEREARAIAGLNHRNIVQVFDHDCDEEGRYIVMELVEGGSLRDVLKQAGGRLPVPVAIRCIEGVARGLAYAHRRGLIHRDVKPSNILMVRDGEEWVPKLVDFGLARMGAESDVSITGYGLGTPHYVAPEQHRDAKSATHAADIYSLGKVFYEMLSGDVPDQVDPEKIPPALAGLIAKCVKSSPEDRYFSAEEFVAALGCKPLGTASPSGLSDSGALCPACGTLSDRDARFCEGCGMGLFRNCPECGLESRVQKKFCPKCGTDPEVFSRLDEAATRVSKYQGERKWSRVQKELDLSRSLRFTARGAKGQRLIATLKAARHAAQQAESRSAAIADEARQLWSAGRLEHVASLLGEYAEINGDLGPLADLGQQLPDAVDKREVRWRAEVKASVDLAIANEDWAHADSLAREEPGFPAPEGQGREEFRASLDGLIREAHADAHGRDARACVERGDWNGALASARAAIELVPSHADAAEVVAAAQDSLTSSVSYNANNSETPASPSGARQPEGRTLRRRRTKRVARVTAQPDPRQCPPNLRVSDALAWIAAINLACLPISYLATTWLGWNASAIPAGVGLVSTVFAYFDRRLLRAFGIRPPSWVWLLLLLPGYFWERRGILYRGTAMAVIATVGVLSPVLMAGILSCLNGAQSQYRNERMYLLGWHATRTNLTPSTATAVTGSNNILVAYDPTQWIPRTPPNEGALISLDHHLHSSFACVSLTVDGNAVIRPTTCLAWMKRTYGETASLVKASVHVINGKISGISSYRFQHEGEDLVWDRIVQVLPDDSVLAMDITTSAAVHDSLTPHIAALSYGLESLPQARDLRGASPAATTALLTRVAASTTSIDDNRMPRSATISTSLGEIEVDFFCDNAPATVMNFAEYARRSHFNGTIFHRVMNGFMIQGGGFTSDMREKQTRSPIPNEATNRLGNLRGTISMARTPDPHSASSQFFINVVDNPMLDHRAPTYDGFGYCVFGRVRRGMDVVDRVASVPTTSMAGHDNVPVQPVMIERVDVK